jgi:hypothetical protein
MTKKPTAATKEPEALPDVFSVQMRAILGKGRFVFSDIKGWNQVVQTLLDEANTRGDVAAELVQLYSYIRTVKEHIDELFKHTDTMLAALASGRIPEAFEREQLQTLTTAEGDRATVVQKLYASILAEKREQAFKWLRDNGHESLITEVVNAQTLSAFARAEAEQGRELPEETFTTHQKPTVTLTRSKATKAAIAAP